MREVRKPAQNAVALGRATLLSSPCNIHASKVIQPKSACQPLRTQNYCDHVPCSPKLFVIPPDHKPRAKIVQETDKKLRDAYRKPKSSLKTLQFHDESGHQVKSQRREACIALLQAMNHYQDDSTGRIGRSMGDGTFRDINLGKISKYAGLNVRRAKRALGDIKRSGYMKITRQYAQDEETGKYHGLPSIRSFLPKFFTDLCVKGGIWIKWFRQRGWAKEREQKKISKEDRHKARAMIGLINTGIKKFGAIVKGVPSVKSNKEMDSHVQHEQKLIRNALELFSRDPATSITDHLRALKEKYPHK